MDRFFNSFGKFYRETHFDTLPFWAFPIATLLLIWILAIVFARLLKKSKQVKTVFVIKKAWILAGLAVSTIVIGVICYWWTRNYFDKHPYQLSLLFSLMIAMLVSVVTLYRLGRQYTIANVAELTHYPKTLSQLETTVTFLKQSFRRLKLFFFLPLAGFLMLLPMFTRGTNLISIILDNTPSQEGNLKMVKDALIQTIEKLDDNNEIVITSFSGRPGIKKTYKDIIATGSYTAGADHSLSFGSKEDAINYLKNQLTTTDPTALSPILEVIWQNFLFTRQEKTNREFDNKILLIVTDGVENNVDLPTGNFLCNEEEYAVYFPPESSFIIDYYDGVEPANTTTNNLFIQKARECGIVVEEGATQADYSFTMEQILSGYSRDWNIIYWTIAVFLITCIAGLLINPSKIE